jgi:hypothetical protein
MHATGGEPDAQHVRHVRLHAGQRQELAGEALGVDIGFDQADGVAVALLPALTEALEIEALFR